jgi:hypothetical protein
MPDALLAQRLERQLAVRRSPPPPEIARPRRVTERQLMGLLLHRTIQRDNLDHAIEGIRSKLRAMGTRCF